MKIAILGPPGSGKGTQIELIVKDFNLNVISVGTILRKMSKQKTTLGITINRIIDSGGLLPATIVDQLLLKKLHHKNCIFDGYPRELAEARFLDKRLKLDKVIYLHIPQKEIISRLKNRRSCSCGMTYNLKTKKPKKASICNLCRKKIVHREDDYPEAIKKRIKLFKKNTIPVIKYYKKKKILVEINADQQAKQTYKAIKKCLNSL
jgi:adenylate kinase